MLNEIGKIGPDKSLANICLLGLHFAHFAFFFLFKNTMKITSFLLSSIKYGTLHVNRVRSVLLALIVFRLIFHGDITRLGF